MRAACAVPDAVVARREVDAWTVVENVTDDPVSFTLHDETTDIVTVEFGVTGCTGAARGSEDTPEEEVARFDTDRGDLVQRRPTGLGRPRGRREQTRIELAQQPAATER